MAQHVQLSIRSGLPFNMTITVTLPNGRDWWTNSADFEVLGQIRDAPDYSGELLLELTPYFGAIAFDGVDEVTIPLSIPGSATRELTRSGYYDIIMSDALQVDNRAFVILEGKVVRSSVVTEAAEEPSV